MGVGIFAVFFTLSQAVALPDYRPVPISYWFKPDFIKEVLELKSQPPTAKFAKTEIKVDCQNICGFQIINPETKLVTRSIPALVDVDANARLKQLELKFYDSDYGLIGYQTVASEPMFYVMNVEGNLLQVIQLDLNHLRRLEFVGYYSESREMKFESENETWLYSANQPSLKFL